MVIPEKITIGGIDIEVDFDPNLMNVDGMIGCALYEEQTIKIDPSVTGPDILCQTFIHEITHFILYVMGRHELRRNEEFVDGFAHLAYQIIKQMEKNQTDIKADGNSISNEEPVPSPIRQLINAKKSHKVTLADLFESGYCTLKKN